MKRIDIFLGTECNNNCLFCCSKGSGEDLTIEQVRDILDKASKDGVKEVHFSGTEPTIRKDFIDIVGYAKKLGFESIKITTNGRMLSYPDFCIKMSEAGVKSVIFSIHGHTGQLHDSLTRVKGSFDQALEGIRNAKKSGLKVESNTTIVKQNYLHLKEIAELLASLELSSSELIFVHPIGNALKEYDKIVPRLIEIEKPLQEAIKVGVDKNRLILSRYVPFCFLGVYVKYASEVYEPLELEQAGVEFYDKEARKTKQEITMKKAEVCDSCRYDLICMGIHKQHKGDELYFRPIPGKKIKDRRELLDG